MPAGAGAVPVGTVVTGQSVTVTAVGSAFYGSEGSTNCTGRTPTDPDGVRRPSPGGLGDVLPPWQRSGSAPVTTTGVQGPCDKKYDANALVPSAPVGTLLGRVGPGAWLPVGSSGRFTAAAPGALQFAFNDSTPEDNLGQYLVQYSTAN